MNIEDIIRKKLALYNEINIKDPIHDIGKQFKFFPAWAVLQFDHKFQVPKVKEALSSQDSTGRTSHGHEDQSPPITAGKKSPNVLSLENSRKTSPENLRSSGRPQGRQGARTQDFFKNFVRAKNALQAQHESTKIMAKHNGIFYRKFQGANSLPLHRSISSLFSNIFWKLLARRRRHLHHGRVFSLYLKSLSADSKPKADISKDNSSLSLQQLPQNSESKNGMGVEVLEDD